MLAGCFLIIVIGLFLAKKANIFQPQEVVLPAISRNIANGMVKENECYIVRITDSYEEEFKFSRWYYMDGTEKKSIFLIGHGPDEELSYIFMKPERNSFLVKGFVHEEMTSYRKQMVFYVEDWYLIAPIKRYYGQEDYRQEQRFFYPRNYLDTYDVEQGDYYPTETYDLTCDWTCGYYLKQEEFYKIRSRWNGSELEWFLVYDDMESAKDNSGRMRYFEDGHIEKKIYIEGNSPEYLLGADVLNRGYDDLNCRDFFMVKGDLKDNGDDIERLEIYKWWIHLPFHYKNELGYWTNDRNGFSRSDIEAGIYNSYR